MTNGNGNGDGDATARCLNPDEVMVGTANGPGIYASRVPGTAPPAVDVEEWPSPWECLGYLSDDGPTVGQSTDSTDIVPWQSVVPIRSVITSRGVTLQFVMWQLSALTLAIYFDVDEPEVDETDGSMDFDIRTDTPQHLYSVGVDARDGDRILRLGFYRASLSAAGDMQIQRGAAIPLDVTLSALDDGGKLANVKMSGGAGFQPISANLDEREAREAFGIDPAHAEDLSEPARRSRAKAAAETGGE
jgi:hypothetical protein